MEEIKETLEFERRWLLKSVPGNINLDNCRKSEIKQWYITTSPVLRLRSHDDKKFILCVKTRGKKDGLGTPEKESELSREEFDNLFKFIKKEPVQKTRYYIPFSNFLMAELDVFYGFGLTGLIILEVEFLSEDEALNFVSPDWFGTEEITGNKAYSNSTLYSLMPELK